MRDETTLKAIKAGLANQLQGPQSAVLAFIQEQVSKIAVLVDHPYPVVERACQELSARATCTVNETLSKLLCSDTETRREFFAILQEQQKQ
jgi:hypothetical protein